MSSTKIKPTASGSFTTITTTTTGLVSKSSTGLPAAPGNLHAALRAVNEWHNQVANPTTTARAAKTLAAQGVSIQEV